MNDQDQKQDLPSVEELAELQQSLEAARDREQRALADYQNLVRRTQQDKARLAKFANRDFVEDLLQPLEHLTIAAENIDEQGLNMVIEQLWQTLEKHGVTRIDALGKEFDVETMEAVEVEDEGAQTVVKVLRPGFKLHDQVIQHAKVVLGSSE